MNIGLPVIVKYLRPIVMDRRSRMQFLFAFRTTHARNAILDFFQQTNKQTITTNRKWGLRVCMRVCTCVLSWRLFAVPARGLGIEIGLEIEIARAYHYLASHLVF